MVTLRDIEDLIQSIKDQQLELDCAKQHIRKVVAQGRAFTKDEIECMQLDHILEAEVK